MESVLGRYRNLIILVGVLFLQVLGLAVQVKRSSNNSDEQDTRLIRIWAVEALSPFERGLIWVENSGAGIWHNYFYLRGVRAENRQLKEQIEQMRLEQVRLTEDAAQAHRLQTLLAFKEQFIAKTVAAQVIGTSGSDLSVYIDKGKDAGLQRDMAVITADGIVGKILVVYPSESQVLLINDQSSGVGVILEKSRLQGVLRGTSNGEVVLERVMSDEQVAVGETVLTSGGDQIFPKGLPVGTVSKVGNGKDLFLNIKIKPAANLSKLEEVLVLVEKQERLATADDNVRVRAADILAQRLPSVPDKPAAETSAAAASATSAKAQGFAKPQGSLKPAANITGKPVPAAAASPAAKDSSDLGTGNGTSTSSQPSKTPSRTSTTSASIPPASTGSASTGTKASTTAGTSTASKPEAFPAKPPTAQPKPRKPSAPPSTSQPSTDEANPH